MHIFGIKSISLPKWVALSSMANKVTHAWHSYVWVFEMQKFKELKEISLIFKFSAYKLRIHIIVKMLWLSFVDCEMWNVTYLYIIIYEINRRKIHCAKYFISIRIGILKTRQSYTKCINLMSAHMSAPVRLSVEQFKRILKGFI